MNEQVLKEAITLEDDFGYVHAGYEIMPLKSTDQIIAKKAINDVKNARRPILTKQVAQQQQLNSLS